MLVRASMGPMEGARRRLPTRLARLVGAVVQEPLEEVRHGYRRKKHRSGPTDYVAEFDHRSMRDAKGSILWHGHWEEQTAATLRILDDLGLVRDGQTVLDYGCGVGRIARALVEDYRVRLICVDRSPQMRKHFATYMGESPLAVRAVSMDDVRLWSDDCFLRNAGGIAGTVDLAIFVEVVQHIPEPVLDALLPQVARTLSRQGRVFVLGNENLDVDSEGHLHVAPVEGFLAKHRSTLRVVRKDVWTEVRTGPSTFRFEVPRCSFVLARNE